MNRLPALPIIAVALVATGCLSASAQDAVRGNRAGDILVRGRALAVVPESGGHVGVIDGRPEASTTATPELDISYFLAPQVSIELIAATTYHDLSVHQSALGRLDLGHTWLLPPTLTIQYHPFPQARLSPYVGIGVNYSIFYGEGGGRSVPVTKVGIDDTLAIAFDAGVNYEIGGPWVANLDAKKLILRPSVSINGGTIHARAELDPWIIGVGIGYRF